MQFDWFTFGASLFNFILLLVLLRLFVFGRIVRAVEARKKRIADTWDEAEEAKAEAEKEASAHRQELEELREHRDQKLKEAQQEADAAREEQLKGVRDEIEQKRRAWEKHLASSQQQLLSQIEKRLAKATLDTVRETFRELADADLEHKMVDRFLAEYDSDEKAAHVQVNTSHELPEGERERIASELAAAHGEAAEIEFAVDKSLLCGIEVHHSDRRIGFSLSHRLAAVHSDMERLVEANQGAGDGK